MSIWGGGGGEVDCAGRPRTEDTTEATYYVVPFRILTSLIHLDFSTLLVFRDSRRIKLLRLLRHLTVLEVTMRTQEHRNTFC